MSAAHEHRRVSRRVLSQKYFRLCTTSIDARSSIIEVWGSRLRGRRSPQQFQKAVWRHRGKLLHHFGHGMGEHRSGEDE